MNSASSFQAVISFKEQDGMESGFIQIAALLSSGFILGIKHAFDLDHVAAVSTIISRTNAFKKSLIHGMAWGSGHTVTLLITGIILMAFKLTISEKMVLFFELLVGLMLILLGVKVMIKDSGQHFFHNTPGLPHFPHQNGKPGIRGAKSFFVGIIHGLAGSAALMLLILSSVKTILSGIAFILIFGLGSVLGMLFFSGMISIPFLITLKNEFMNRGLQMFMGSISTGLGASIIYENGRILIL
jgi:hypothetical protein